MCENAVNFQRIADGATNVQVKKIFTILSAGEEELCNSSQSIPKQAVLVLGNANSGKSTFTRWIAGQDSKFISKPDEINPGEYDILDPEGKVGKSSSPSVPILVSRSGDDAFYYDFPAFADPRGVAYDVAANYFTKKFVNNFSGVKLCFFIEHYMMTSNGNRDDFPNFLKHIINVVKDVDKVKSSVVLVVSKVPSALAAISDDQIIDAIVLFMQQLRQKLVRQTEQSETENLKMMEFLDLFTLKEQTVYPSLALFRSPNQLGPVPNITLLQENKVRVREKLQNLRFAKTTGDDFGYTISKPLLYDITRIVREIRDSIVIDVKISGSKIQQYFAAKEAMIDGAAFDSKLIHVYEQMKAGYERMVAIRTSCGASSNLKQCLNQIVDGFGNMTGNSIKLDLSSTLASADALHFLLAITGDQESEFMWCIDGLADVIQYLDNSQKWYLFAKRLYDRLLNRDTSRAMGTYDITDKEIGKKVSHTDLQMFLLKSPQEQLYFQYNDVKDVVLTEFKLKSAKLIASLTTKYRQNFNQTGWKGPSIGDLYGTRGYLNDLYHLENQFYNVSNGTSYLPYYQSLFARVEDYIKKRAANNATTSYFGDYRALNYLRVATLSRIHNLGNSLDNYLVVDFDGYFSLVEKHITDYRKPLKEVRIEVYRKQYENTINTQIIEAYTVLESIMPEMNKIYDAIDDEIMRLIKVIGDLEKQGNQQKELLFEQRKKLASQLKLRVLTGLLKTLCVAASFCGPIGAVASAAGGLIANGVDDYVNAGEYTASSMIAAAQQFAYSIKDVYPLERNSLRENLSNIDEINESPEVMALIAKDEGFKNITNLVANQVKLLDDSSLTENVYWQEKKHIKEELDLYYKQLLQKQTNLRKPRATDEETQEKKIAAMIKWVERAKAGLAVAETGIQRGKDYSQSRDLISKVDDAIRLVDDSIDKLKEYENSIRVHLMGEIDTIQANMIAVLRNSAGKSHAALGKNKWMLQNLMRDLKTNIEFMIQIPTPGSPIKQTIITCIEKLNAGINTSIQICDRIQDYQDRTKLANYFADLSSEKDPKDDPGMSSDIEKLELQIKANLVLQEYQIALGTFKQYMFPFVNSFLDRFDTTPYLKPRDTNDLVSTAAQQISQLRDDLSLSSTTVGKLPDAVFFDVRFDATEVEQKPFFIWRHDTHQEKISKLLQGREITLEADITEIRNAGDVNLNAVKFKEIGIRFLSPNKTMENELRELLTGFWVKLVHLGNSQYRCGNQYFTFDHNLISMTHSVNTLNDTQHKPYYHYQDTTTTNIKRNAPIFSPYATWKIQLKNRSAIANSNELNFKKLEIFRQQQIDLALEGNGGHIEFPARSCRDDLEKYYKLSGTLTQHSQQPFYDHYRSDPNAYSSANSIKSPINIVINWVTSTLGYFKSFWIPNTMRYNLIKYNFRSIIAHSKLSDIHPTEDYASVAATSAHKLNLPINTAVNLIANFFLPLKFINPTFVTTYMHNLVGNGIESTFQDSTSSQSNTHSTTVPKFDEFSFHGAVTLADFLVRCVTNVKPYDNSEKSTDMIEVRAATLDLITEFEEFLSRMTTKLNLPNQLLEFDPVDLISRLEKNLTERNYQNLAKILFQSIDDNAHLDYINFESEMQPKIALVAAKQGGENFFNCNSGADNKTQDTKYVFSVKSNFNRIFYHAQSQENSVGIHRYQVL